MLLRGPAAFPLQLSARPQRITKAVPRSSLLKAYNPIAAAPEPMALVAIAATAAAIALGVGFVQLVRLLFADCDLVCLVEFQQWVFRL